MNTGTVVIEGLRVYAHHGVHAQETRAGNTFEINLYLSFDPSESMRTDRLDTTINYAEVTEMIKLQMSRPAKLLEHVAHRIVLALQRLYPRIISGRIEIYKIQPPIAAEVARTGFVYSW